MAHLARWSSGRESVVEAICQMRRELGAGPHRLAYHLKMAASKVYAVLRRVSTRP